MFKKVRTQFVIIGMTATFVVTLSLILAINLVSIYMTNTRLSQVLEKLTSTQKETSHSQETSSQNAYSREPKDKTEGEKPQEKEETQAPDASQEDTGAQASLPSSRDEKSQSYSKEPSSGTGSGKGRHSNRSIPAQYKGRYFKVRGLESEPLIIESTNEELLADLDVDQLVKEIVAKGKKQGFIEGFRYLVAGDKDPYICFLDCSTELSARRTLWLISFIVGLAGILLSLLFIYQMSEWSIRPLKISMEKQKQFITDAGHELKTPLSVIATDMDLLAMDYGENEWVESAKRQVRKLRKLVTSLISLSKMEEETSLVLLNSSLSDMALECADTYQLMASAQGKALEASIQEDLNAVIDPSSVQQLFSILCDNAIKYSTEKSTIQVRLYASGKRIHFETENDWEHGIAPTELDRLFDRFYRGDSSRNKSKGKEGYGLGLSIAKACAEKNHAALKVFQNQEGRLVFQASFTRALSRGAKET